MSCPGDTFFTRLASGKIDGKTVAFAGDAGRVNVATGRLFPQSSGIYVRIRTEAAAAISIAATMQELLTACVQCEVSSKASSEARSMSDQGPVAPENEVDFHFFKVHLWREMKGTDQLAPAVVWREIQTFIKGHRKVADSSEGFLSQEDYLELVGMKMNWAVRGCRDHLYNLFLGSPMLPFCPFGFWYERTKKAINGFDRMDVAFDVLRRLQLCFGCTGRQSQGREFCSLKLGRTVTKVHAFITSMWTKCRPVPSLACPVARLAIVFVGDTCQTVSSETDFRFKDLRSCVKEIFYPTSSPEVVKDLWSLLVNYRSHDGIVQASNRVVSLLEELFPMTIDKLPAAMGQSAGPPPECLNFDELSRLLRELDSSRSSASKCLLGANQLVIVRSEDQKDQFLKVAAECTSGRDAGIVMTAESLGTMMDEIAAKGLEFTDVLMYNFIKDSAYGHWTQLLQSHTNFSKEGSANAEKAIACLELKRLYVAVTRAKKRLLIYEDTRRDDAAVKAWLPWS
ncbi:TRANK1 [Symbiodinium sp. CCMP2592]|nr:TRANK1 [Symbiodinium sp. CCMP2592]